MARIIATVLVVLASLHAVSNAVLMGATDYVTAEKVLMTVVWLAVAVVALTWRSRTA